MLTFFLLKLRYSALPTIYIETTRKIYPYFERIVNVKSR